MFCVYKQVHSEVPALLHYSKAAATQRNAVEWPSCCTEPPRQPGCRSCRSSSATACSLRITRTTSPVTPPTHTRARAHAATAVAISCQLPSATVRSLPAAATYRRRRRWCCHHPSTARPPPALANTGVNAVQIEGFDASEASILTLQVTRQSYCSGYRAPLADLNRRRTPVSTQHLQLHSTLAAAPSHTFDCTGTEETTQPCPLDLPASTLFSAGGLRGALLRPPSL